MKGKYRYRIFAILVFGVMLWNGWESLQKQIPDQLTVAQDEANEKLLSRFLPKWVEESGIENKNSIENENSIEAGNSRNIECSILGVLPIKEVQVDYVERAKVIPGGIPVGIYMKTSGVLVIGTGEVCDMEGNVQIPVENLVQAGDYILEVNGVAVSEKEEVIKQINTAQNGQIYLKILRGKEELELLCPVVQTGPQEQKAGIWIRDDTQGIGTLTYIKEDGNFGALGHGISDIDTSTLLSLEKGKLYQAQIQSIVKGISGIPGELAGMIQYQKSQILGDIEANTDIGIFGQITADVRELVQTETVEVAYKQEIEEGAAQILSAVSGEIRAYDIEIEKVNLNSKDANKGMVIRVTDSELLNLTGGIVQGMGVIDNRDNTKKPGNTGFFSSYPKNDPTIGV